MTWVVVHINTANYCYDINVFLVAKAAAKIALPGFFIQKSSLFPQRHIILFALLLQIQVFLFNFIGLNNDGIWL